MIEVLHFLRPFWLLALPAIALTWWLVRRRESGRANVGTFVAPHLREALTINRDARKGVRAVDGVVLAMLFMTVAAA
jgi:Ca-activated chloride channel family protein